MKLMSRNFSKKEKALLLILIVVLIALGYYQFFYVPTTQEIENNRTEQAALQSELTGINTKIASLTRMKEELDSIDVNKRSYMPSYNASKQEMQFLDSILANTVRYSISFPTVTRNGDQVRRNFSLSFAVNSYDEAQSIVTALASSKLRCMLSDIKYSVNLYWLRDDYDRRYGDAYLSVSMSATFYETMVEGTPDSGLPASKK